MGCCRLALNCPSDGKHCSKCIWFERTVHKQRYNGRNVPVEQAILENGDYNIYLSCSTKCARHGNAALRRGEPEAQGRALCGAPESRSDWGG